LRWPCFLSWRWVHPGTMRALLRWWCFLLPVWAISSMAKLRGATESSRTSANWWIRLWTRSWWPQPSFHWFLLKPCRRGQRRQLWRGTFSLPACG
jgi:hypothetical protein